MGLPQTMLALMKRTIEVNDTLEETLGFAVAGVKARLLEHLEWKAPGDAPEFGDVEGVDRAIVEAMPTGARDAETIMFLYPDKMRQAFQDEGLEDMGAEGWETAALLAFVVHYVKDWYRREAPRIFEDWQDC